MNWHKVKVVAKEGMQFAILYDDKGELALMVKSPGEDWPHKLKPNGGENQIGEGCKAYVVVTDDYIK
jgi:hypothetical protein